MKKLRTTSMVQLMISADVCDAIMDEKKDFPIRPHTDPRIKDAVKKGIQFAEGLGAFDSE